MPNLGLPHQDIEKISHYLLRKIQVPGNLKYMTWRGKVWEGLEGDVEKEAAGQVADFNLESMGKSTIRRPSNIQDFLKLRRKESTHLICN